MIAIHYTYHAFLHAEEIDTFYMIGILQVNHHPQKFPDKNAGKNINMKRQISLQSIMCIAKLSENVNFTWLTGHKTETILKKMFWQRDSTSIKQNIHIIPQKAKNAKIVVCTW